MTAIGGAAGEAPRPAHSGRPAGKLTPMMAQYWDIKEQHPGAILLFRMGDFYETFYDDAAITARELGIALTTRDRNTDAPVPLAGVPHHSVDSYIARLLRAGYTVAVCEQLEDPALAKGLVKRAVTEVLTPGTALTPDLLSERENHFALALCVTPDQAPEARTGYALLDFSTGEFLLGERGRRDVVDVVARYGPGELFLPRACLGSELERFFHERFENLPVGHIEDASFSPRVAAEVLRKHFGVSSLAGLDCGDLPEGVRAAGALLDHGTRLKQGRLQAVTRLQVVRSTAEMFLDEDTLANLEIFRPLRGQDPSVTLVHQMDTCRTAMGSRLLRAWLRAPLRDREAATARHQAVAWWVEQRAQLEELRELLAPLADLERLLGRIAADRATPRDLLALAESATRLPAIRTCVAAAPVLLLANVQEQLDTLEDLARDISTTLVDEPPAHLRDGGVIRAGVSEELDGLLAATREARDWIATLQQSERDATGIGKLKVGYNKVFGYFLEVPRSQAERVPSHYIGKQTLVGAQRYVTPELKEKEQVVLRAESERIRIEVRLFGELRQRIADAAPRIRNTAAALATLDTLAGFAALAHKRSYTAPRLTEGGRIWIRAGRHPVVERLLDEPFVPNDIDMSRDEAQILLITGPNMGGKSTFLRQTALIVLMAYAGSFVPAAEAEIGAVDRIFTRVGASDNLARGQSTFLVEMTETAKILNACTPLSLVILDEVGRGTSTHDGMSLAWAILEYLHTGPAAPRTLFATHYHELTVLESNFARVRNLSVAVREWQDEIVFLHRILPGSADKSYGIQVAQLAGLPQSVIARAKHILAQHERMETDLGERAHEPSRQLDLFAGAERAVCERLRQNDPELLDAAAAKELLRQLRRML